MSCVSSVRVTGCSLRMKAVIACGSSSIPTTPAQALRLAGSASSSAINFSRSQCVFNEVNAPGLGAPPAVSVTEDPWDVVALGVALDDDEDDVPPAAAEGLVFDVAPAAAEGFVFDVAPAAVEGFVFEVAATSVGVVNGLGPGSAAFWKRTSLALAEPPQAIGTKTATTITKTAQMGMTTFLMRTPPRKVAPSS